MTLSEFLGELDKHDKRMSVKFADGAKRLGIVYGYVKAWHIDRELIQLHMRKFDDNQSAHDVICIIKDMIAGRRYNKSMLYDDVSVILRESDDVKAVYRIGNVKLMDGYIGVECVFGHNIFSSDEGRTWFLRGQEGHRKYKRKFKLGD